MTIAKKLTKIIASSVEPLDAYTIAMMYWENEKYMFPESQWHIHEPKKEEFSGTSILQSRDVSSNEEHIAVERQAKARG